MLQFASSVASFMIVIILLLGVKVTGGHNFEYRANPFVLQSNGHLQGSSSSNYEVRRTQMAHSQADVDNLFLDSGSLHSSVSSSSSLVPHASGPCASTASRSSQETRISRGLATSRTNATCSLTNAVYNATYSPTVYLIFKDHTFSTELFRTAEVSYGNTIYFDCDSDRLYDIYGYVVHEHQQSVTGKHIPLPL